MRETIRRKKRRGRDGKTEREKEERGERARCVRVRNKLDLEWKSLV